MSFVSQNLVLGGKNALDRTHQRAAFAGQITVYFFLEIGFKQVSATHGDTQCSNPFLGSACGILENGVTAIQSTTLQEHPSEGSTGSLGGNQEYVYIGRWNDTRLFFERDAEAMGKVQCLSFRQVFFYGGPEFDLCSIT